MGYRKYGCLSDAANIPRRDDKKGSSRHMGIVSSKHPQRKCTKCNSPVDLKGSGSYCRKCYNAYRRDRRKQGFCTETYEQRRDLNLRQNYGLTLEEYNLMFFRQAGLCAICHQPEHVIDPYTKQLKWLVPDHNHDTGDIRELLCHTCNFVLGFVESRRHLVKDMVKYLKKHDI